MDTRSDNIRVHPGAVPPLRIFDWPFACVGPPELDFVGFAQSVTCEGGPTPEALTRWYAEAAPVRERQLAGAAAGIAGFFALRAWQPPVEGLPRLRSIQRRQLKASLGWAARLLELPEPLWLSAVQD
jgi:aminoglycoside phosphotransferase (APT) family kinase protein